MLSRCRHKLMNLLQNFFDMVFMTLFSVHNFSSLWLQFDDKIVVEALWRHCGFKKFPALKYFSLLNVDNILTTPSLQANKRVWNGWVSIGLKGKGLLEPAQGKEECANEYWFFYQVRWLTHKSRRNKNLAWLAVGLAFKASILHKSFGLLTVAGRPF